MATKKVRKWYAFLMTCLFSFKFVQMKVFIRLGASENEQYSIQFGGCIVYHMVSEREKNQKEIWKHKVKQTRISGRKINPLWIICLSRTMRISEGDILKKI